MRYKINYEALTKLKRWIKFRMYIFYKVMCWVMVPMSTIYFFTFLWTAYITYHLLNENYNIWIGKLLVVIGWGVFWNFFQNNANQFINQYEKELPEKLKVK